MCLPLTCVYVFICVRYLQWDKLWSHRFKSPVIKTRRGKSIRFFVPCLFYSTERWQHRAAVTDTGPVVRFSDEKTKWINTPVVDAMWQRLILCRWAWNMHAFLNLKILSLCSQSISLWQSFVLQTSNNAHLHPLWHHSVSETQTNTSHWLTRTCNWASPRILGNATLQDFFHAFAWKRKLCLILKLAIYTDIDSICTTVKLFLQLQHWPVISWFILSKYKIRMALCPDLKSSRR